VLSNTGSLTTNATSSVSEVLSEASTREADFVDNVIMEDADVDRELEDAMNLHLMKLAHQETQPTISCEIHSADELHDIKDSRSSVIRECYQQFKSNLYNTKSSILPCTNGIKLIKSIYIKNLRAVAAETREHGGLLQWHESLFVYKIAYDCSIARGDPVEMSKCIYDLTNTIRSRSLKSEGNKRGISTQCKGTCEEALSLLDHMPFDSDDTKLVCKAMCLHGIGSLFCKLGDHDEAILKHELAITLLNQTSEESTRNIILYADCFNDKGVSLIRKRHFKKAQRCFRSALKAYKKATDFDSEQDRSQKLKRTKQNLKSSQEFHRECIIL